MAHSFGLFIVGQRHHDSVVNLPLFLLWHRRLVRRILLRRILLRRALLSRLLSGTRLLVVGERHHDSVVNLTLLLLGSRLRGGVWLICSGLFVVRERQEQPILTRTLSHRRT